MTSSLKCPVCGKQFSQGVSTFPFCSDRCSRIDLGRWLREDYAIPVKKSKGTDDETLLSDPEANGPEGHELD